MEKIQKIGLALLLLPLGLSAQTLENVPYADFESWTVRQIRESGIIGGQEKTLYVIGPEETIKGNSVYDYSKTIWSSSNAYAKVAGIVKVSTSMTPDVGPTGKCAKLETCYADCQVAGIVTVKVITAGSIFWGKLQEPVSDTSNPFASADWGIPFTKKPSAVVLDYKSVISQSGSCEKCSPMSHSTLQGNDPAEVIFILQKRWEDENGNIHALRVGTAICHIEQSSDGWVTSFRLPVIYGDASKDPSYKSYMKLSSHLYAKNSRGKLKIIQEDGWADSSSEVTHALMKIQSGSRGAFVGVVGNVLWIDNIKLEYE